MSRRPALHVVSPDSDLVPAVGWPEALDRNRVDAAVGAARAAVEAALAEVRKAQHLPPSMVDRMLTHVGLASDNLGDAESSLRRPS